jgi:hypothetical protein
MDSLNYTLRVSVETPEGLVVGISRKMPLAEVSHYRLSDLIETKLHEAVAELVASDAANA